MIEIRKASLLTKEEYENNSRIPKVCGGYWLRTPAGDGRVYFVWSDMNTAICTPVAPDIRAGIRPVLVADGIAGLPRNASGLAEYGGEEWLVLDDERMVSASVLGICEFSKTKATDFMRSDALTYIMDKILPKLEEKEDYAAAGRLTGSFAPVSRIPVADGGEQPTIVEEIGKHQWERDAFPDASSL